MKAIVVREAGDASVLKLEDVPEPTLQRGEALVRNAAAGVNFIEVYQRKGVYKVALPATPGAEGAGVVERVEGESAIRVGDHVAYVNGRGSYAEKTAVPIDRLVPVPAGVALDVAAGAMLQGMTAQFLSASTYPIAAGDDVLVHAAAGGVGALLVQMAKRRGARVIATVGGPAKIDVAKAAGADHVIDYRAQDFLVETRKLTGDRGVAVVYDSVGKDTFERSLDSLRPRGMMVLFGGASGPVPPFDPLTLSAKGSLYLTRPTLFTYTRTAEELHERASAVLSAIARGELSIRIGATFPLAAADDAHRALEGRGTVGKLLLVPSRDVS